MVPVSELAAELGRRKQTLFKVISRLQIEVVKLRGLDSRGQLASFISEEDAERVRSALSSPVASKDLVESSQLSPAEAELGHFYFLALEPVHDKGRFKLGFASVLGERLQKHRCAAPLLEVVATWPCKRLWERTAIDAASYDCERLHTEVFRAADIATVRERLDRFFALMPTVPVRGRENAL